jgi:hypothetical protein
MKQLIFFILFAYLDSFGQKTLNGNFCFYSDFSGFCINFNSDSTFTYDSWHCIGGYKGQGKFEIIKDSLLLHFISADTVETQYFINPGKINNEYTLLALRKPQVTINLKVYNKVSKDLLPSAQITFLDSTELNDKIILTDSTGNAKVRLNKEKKEVEMIVKFFGFKSLVTKINTNESIDITIQLAPVIYPFEVPNKTVWRYKVLAAKKNRMTLKGDYDPFKLFRKK